MTKIIAFYLPQFHAIPENDEWWGKGFTEWTNVRNSKPNYRGHYQPEVPLEKNYYSLLDEKTQIWQSELALNYNVDGFCYYHYWFDGRLLLEKPMENMLTNEEIKIPFCICWANESWSRTWTGNEKEVLIKQNYDSDNKSIEAHFNYLLKFFKDERYIKKNNKPVFIIYKPYLIENLSCFIEIWNRLARENGFDGIWWGHQSSLSFNYDVSSFDFGIEFEPFYTRQFEAEKEKEQSRFRKYILNPKRLIKKLREKIRGGWTESYDYFINASSQRSTNNHSYLGAFPSWDNTPRRGKKSYMVKGSTPEKFEKYLRTVFEKNRNKENNDYIFINAWNEWAEGAHLEPAEKYGLKYLEVIKKVTDEYKSVK